MHGGKDVSLDINTIFSGRIKKPLFCQGLGKMHIKARELICEQKLNLRCVVFLKGIF